MDALLTPNAVPKRPWTLVASRAVYVAAYLAAGIVAALGAFGAAAVFPGASAVALAIAAGAAATLFLYLSGVIFKNSGFYDVYWSVFPWIAGIAWMVTS